MKSSPGEERDQSFSLLACNIQTNTSGLHFKQNLQSLRQDNSKFRTCLHKNHIPLEPETMKVRKFNQPETRQCNSEPVWTKKPHPSGTRPWYTHKHLNTWTSSSYVPHRSTNVWIASTTQVSIRLPHLWQYRKNYTPKKHPYTSLKQNCGCGYEKKQQFSTSVCFRRSR